jgi:hypothetical protein
MVAFDSYTKNTWIKIVGKTKQLATIFLQKGMA